MRRRLLRAVDLVNELARQLLAERLDRLRDRPDDRDFLLDAVPGQTGVWFAIGAGHAFKFASVLGRILSELALDGQTRADIETFRLDRPLLQQENPPKRFLI